MLDTIGSSSNSSIKDINTTSKEQVLEVYNKDYNKDSTLDTHNIHGNTKLLDSYYSKSSLLLFLSNKNRSILVNLVYRTNLDLNKDSFIQDSSELYLNLEECLELTLDDFNLIEQSIISILNEISTIIPTITILSRQRIRNASTKDARNYKDFIALDSNST